MRSLRRCRPGADARVPLLVVAVEADGPVVLQREDFALDAGHEGVGDGVDEGQVVVAGDDGGARE